ncbi:ferritin-like domain-containing protein [Klebsiella sp. 10982]|uniref:Domain of uncharacterized function (DUF892) n=1 Tax=Klebsiella quasivariicola TaxID=2026240 RepID=A0ABY6WQY6_9ENTR|nr:MULTISPECIES: DUF892 family protein [Klebsiella]MEA1148866.1 DUF892 family protein [Klebsiella pneumoniae]QBL49382.1 ferritin-like domain-containing protein [Klebsiella sp. PO552]ASV20195.1 ferritin-like domain-containing protein [Klebsiella quasivariicola]MBF7818152.1 ferritin-like domain-containing protein [Klebsiella quasivariicola]MBK2371033.1 ferritin-like domain-containing protein [Klebsiella quasivariicola]
MTDIENYHNWLRDAHAMEKQAETMLIAVSRRVENYPPLRTRLEQHLYETRRQLSALQDLIARNHISRSALKEAMSRVAALGQTIGMMLPGDEIVKIITTTYVFAQFEVACYTALLTAAKRAGDHHALHALEAILAEERGMADWLRHHQSALVAEFLHRAERPGVEVGH